MVGQEDVAVRIEGLSKDGYARKMDMLERWICSKDGYARKRGMFKRWKDRLDMFERWKHLIDGQID